MVISGRIGDSIRCFAGNVLGMIEVPAFFGHRSRRVLPKDDLLENKTGRYNARRKSDGEHDSPRLDRIIRVVHEDSSFRDSGSFGIRDSLEENADHGLRDFLHGMRKLLH